ncbi:hypothetical protein [Pseudomonas nunensis]|uniref:hypothetical protein n=1 Tax=Pseudomonas nunensis TaxID=2961896 RepID=UPI0006B3FBC6|nr:hypothetical protein [Pseudomonas nunensis]KOY02794.1 hypothetical protein AM274_08220 [Pseudomonas nunensis]
MATNCKQDLKIIAANLPKEEGIHIGNGVAESDLPVVISNRNEPVIGVALGKELDAVMSWPTDVQLAALCTERENDLTIKVSIYDL